MSPVIKFGRYELLGQLSKGKAASVYLARISRSVAQDAILCELFDAPASSKPENEVALVCVKTLVDKWAKDQHLIDMFEDEGQLAIQLDHMNCVKTFDAGKVGDTYFIAMEYLAGRALNDIIETVARNQIKLDESMVALVVGRACDALHYVHELKNGSGEPYNIVHRDICPHNLFLTYSGIVKLMDFGILKANTDRRQTVSGVVKGRFTYMSPEHFSGGTVDRRSDVFSMGILLYETLAHQRFYKHSDPKDIARILFRRELPSLGAVVPNADFRLKAICEKALSFEPQHRFSTAQEMAKALYELVEFDSYGHGTEEISKLLQTIFGEKAICDSAHALKELRKGDQEPTEELLAPVSAQLVAVIPAAGEILQ